jgi:hypothetical protein
MNNSLWIIVVIIAAFVSFLVGYSRPHDTKKVFTSTSSITLPMQPVAMANRVTDFRIG